MKIDDFFEDSDEEDPEPVELVIEDERWLDADLEPLCQRALDAVSQWLGQSDLSIVVLACDDARIAVLNDEFRDKPRPTNVLSWPSSEFAAHAPGERPELPPMAELGDIAIAYDTCQREAAEQGKTFADHVTHLLVHAILHLAGYDHIDDSDAETMEGAERVILAELGISDPYFEIER
ncbi:rRNA maturation RNase YbeY [Paracoccus sp. (in: a-proteobacteria)]|uniref:rRNA maturation RNase YbeY n=1 Tax=Paracoccus sp. TaxID=267 RepID=UPI00289EDEA7|nr:rRNA maturation RNase YbeY [Paracoccus sp. (in: a-proteobacteria)]